MLALLRRLADAASPPEPPPAPLRWEASPPHARPRLPRYAGEPYDPPRGYNRTALAPYVRYAETLALRLREHWAADEVTPGEREAFVGGLRELMEQRIEPGTSPATVHRRMQWLKSFRLPPDDVHAVLGEHPSVEAYFEARQRRRHLFDGQGRCAVCDVFRDVADSSVCDA